MTAGRNAAARQRLASPEWLVLFLERREVKDDWWCDSLRRSGGLVVKWKSLNTLMSPCLFISTCLWLLPREELFKRLVYISLINRQIAVLFQLNNSADIFHFMLPDFLVHEGASNIFVPLSPFLVDKEAAVDVARQLTFFTIIKEICRFNSCCFC